MNYKWSISQLFLCASPPHRDRPQVNWTSFRRETSILFFSNESFETSEFDFVVLSTLNLGIFLSGKATCKATLENTSVYATRASMYCSAWFALTDATPYISRLYFLSLDKDAGVIIFTASKYITSFDGNKNSEYLFLALYVAINSYFLCRLCKNLDLELLSLYNIVNLTHSYFDFLIELYYIFKKAKTASVM